MTVIVIIKLRIIICFTINNTLKILSGDPLVRRHAVLVVILRTITAESGIRNECGNIADNIIRYYWFVHIHNH